MKKHFRAAAALAIGLVGGVLVPAIKADELNKKTIIAINRPIDGGGN